MRRLIISAPFGNYVRPDGATPTLGTFTAARRRGRVWRVLATVRRSRRMGAWVNRIGLRNPGIDWLVGRVRSGRADVAGALVSVHGFSDDDWRALVEKAASIEPLGVELNMSCPNVGEVDWPEDLFGRALGAMGSPERVVVKLPPVRFEGMLASALDAGVRAFHCCNTLPVPGGGLSGKPLTPLSLRCIADVRAAAAARSIDGLTIIGGGGITTTGDIDAFAEAGATHVALGTHVFTPRALWSDGLVRPLIEHADRALGPTGA